MIDDPEGGNDADQGHGTIQLNLHFSIRTTTHWGDSKRQLKGFVACAAKQSYPNGMPPAVNWTAPQQCLDKYAGMQECQLGEVGYAMMKTSDPKTSANLIYGTAVGGCKDSVNYYAIVGQGGPKALTAKSCTSLNTKVRGQASVYKQYIVNGR